MKLHIYETDSPEQIIEIKKQDLLQSEELEIIVTQEHGSKEYVSISLVGLKEIEISFNNFEESKEQIIPCPNCQGSGCPMCNGSGTTEEYKDERMERDILFEKLKIFYSDKMAYACLNGTRKPSYEVILELAMDEINPVPFEAWKDIKSYIK